MDHHSAAPAGPAPYGVIANKQPRALIQHQLRDAALNRPHHRNHPSSHGLQQSDKHALKVKSQQDRLTALQKGLHLLRYYAALKLNSPGHAGLTDEIFASCTFGTISNQVSFDLAVGLARLDEDVHYQMPEKMG